jgi:hypothetical protein
VPEGAVFTSDANLHLRAVPRRDLYPRTGSSRRTQAQCLGHARNRHSRYDGARGGRPSGLKVVGKVPPAASTPADQLAMWCDRLPSPAPEMLRTLAARGEHYVDADELAAVLGKKPTGGHWNSGIAVLRNNGLIATDSRRYRTAALFRE